MTARKRRVTTLGNRLRALREARGVGQEDVAAAIRTLTKSRTRGNAVSRWERDDAVPSVEHLAALAQYYRVTMNYLLRGEP